MGDVVRNLAHIETIESLMPIEGADKIEVARVLGWNCVVKRGEFKVGDLAVYVEIDSVLPDKPHFEFMRPRKFRVKTIRLKNVLSQGLLFPLDVFQSYGKLVYNGNSNIIGLETETNLQNNKSD